MLPDVSRTNLFSNHRYNQLSAGELFAVRNKLSALQEQLAEALTEAAVAKRQHETAKNDLASVEQVCEQYIYVYVYVYIYKIIYVCVYSLQKH